MRPANILLVDDDRNFLRVLTHHVQEFGFRPSPASSAKEALKRLEDEKVDLVITDLKMPEMDGLSLLEAIQKRDQDLPVLVLTAFGSIDIAVDAIKRGAFDFLSKPFDKEEMRHAIGNALKMAHLVQENRELSKVVRDQFTFEGIVGSSKKFHETLALGKQLAQVDTTVLITGESGTGKEILARAIHFNSVRAGKPFVAVNCGAIPENLLESELFGHRKGAFTGAVADRKGRFETADGGTLFLDEVGELPLNMQVKLLRALQEREIDALGDPRPRKVDVRILAATNQDLSQRMMDGEFRSDLFYRLSVAPVHVPPLRERREDIPLLAHHFLEIFNKKFGKKVTLDPEAVDVLQRSKWPGNVRELENIIHRLVVFDLKGTVAVEDLPPELKASFSPVGKIGLRLPEEGFSLEELERDLLVAALEKHDWNQTKAAQYLGITRNTLIYRMQKFDLKQVGSG